MGSFPAPISRLDHYVLELYEVAVAIPALQTSRGSLLMFSTCEARWWSFLLHSGVPAFVWRRTAGTLALSRASSVLDAWIAREEFKERWLS